jgi:hypothetical protein
VKADDAQSELDWDFYFFVANTLLNWNRDDFFNSTPNHLLKQFIMHLRYTNPDALVSEKQVYTLDQTPFI